MILLSKSQIKLITSLQQKKYRTKWRLFVAEGPKVIKELIEEGFVLNVLYSVKNELFVNKKPILISEKELSKISFLKNANTSLAVFEIPQNKINNFVSYTLVLDSVRDPGNLGTIIRLCDWFGIPQIVCSEDTVDCYNPKVIQATMGSIARVNLHYTCLKSFLKKTDLPIYATAMNGDNVYKQQFSEKAIIVLGNEANGISDEIMKLSNMKIAIPQFGVKKETESLNVATAAAIILSELKRTTEL